MYRILLCHRRRKEIGYAQFHDHWRQERRQLILQLQPQLGYQRYAQLHQLPRRNLIYRAIRASRSWLVVAFVSVFQRRKIPRLPRDRRTQVEERWDAIDELWYDSREALIQALTSEAGIEAARRVVDDHTPHVRRTAVVTAEEFEAARDPESRGERISTMFCLRSPTGMTREEMLEYWGSSHKQLFLSVQSSLRYRAYSQLHVRSAPELSSVVDSLGGSDGEEFDGVASVAYGHQWELILGFFNPFAQIANLRLIKDEINFIDGQRSALVFGREYQER